MKTERIDIGDMVVCDFCNADDESLMGGGMIGSNAVCQTCYDGSIVLCREEYPEELDMYSLFDPQLTFQENVLRYREEHYGDRGGFIEVSSW